MENQSKELFEFVNNPKYRQKIINQIHREEDRLYNSQIRTVNKEISRLEKNRINEISRISASRWEKIGSGRLEVNRTEGKIRFNNTTALFSDILGSELNMMEGYHTETVSKQKMKGKKHVSIIGAAAGGLVAGPVGAVVGGTGLGKTNYKDKGRTTSNTIQTCNHLGVMVNIQGYVSEIVLLQRQETMNSTRFVNAQKEAYTIIAQLDMLSKTPVPISYVEAKDEDTVKRISDQLCKKKQELQILLNNKPQYKLPDIYKIEERKNMSDEEYLRYLNSEDIRRSKDLVEKKEHARQEAKNAKVAMRQGMQENIYNLCQDSKAKESNKRWTVGRVLYDIVFWFLSLISLYYGFACLVGGGICISMLLFWALTIIINPVTGNLIRNNIYYYPRWISFPLFIIIFYLGNFLAPF